MLCWGIGGDASFDSTLDKVDANVRNSLPNVHTSPHDWLLGSGEKLGILYDLTSSGLRQTRGLYSGVCRPFEVLGVWFPLS